MEQKRSGEVILSDFDADNDLLTPCLDSCQNSNVWPYCQNVLFKSFPIEEEIVEVQDSTVNLSAHPLKSISNLDSVGCEYPKLEAVTHIEIIKSTGQPSRRVTGASRVVPSLSSAWHRTNFQASEPSITDVYTKFMDCETGAEAKCEACHQEFVSSAEVACHVRLHHPEIVLTPDYCFVCRKKYMFASQVKNHLSTYHGIQFPDRMCKICFMELNTSIETKAHERKHNKEFNCLYCALEFASEYAYQKHCDTHMLTLKPFECPSCGKRFFNEISHDVHLNRHTKLSCLSCDLVFNEERLYLQHIKSHAPDAVKHLLSRTALLDREEDHLDGLLQEYRKACEQPLPEAESCVDGWVEDVQSCMESMLVAVESTTPAVTSGPKKCAGAKLEFECKLCQAQTATAKDLVEHHQARHGRSRTCPFCRVLSASLSQLQKHIATHLKAQRRTPPSTPPFACTFCGKSFRKKSKWNNHLETVHEVSVPSRPFGCPDCPRNFVNEPSRDKHLVAAHGEERTVETCVRCEICKQAFVRPKYLARHLRAVHETVHACTLCDKIFDTKATLKRHEEGHKPASQRQKYKCVFCSVCCSTHSGLRVHMRTHTDERPFGCDVCDKRFKRPQALKKHKLLLHSDKEAISRICPDCPLKFYDHGNLLRHFLRIHRGLCRFVCGLCGDRFGQNHDLRRHLKMKHDTEIPGLKGSNKKSVKEIYVLPPTESVDISEEVAAKIRKAVEEENLKFEGFSERFEATSRQNEIIAISEAENRVLGSFENVLTLAPEFPSVEAVSVQQASASCSQSLGLQLLQNPPTFIGLLARVEEVPQLYQCDLCQTFFCLAAHFQEHVAKRKENSCQFCADSFCEPVTLQNHLDTAHKTLPSLQMLDICYRCGICQVDFTKKDSLTEHLQDVHDVTVHFDISPEDICPSVSGRDMSKINCGLEDNLMLGMTGVSQGQQAANQIPVTVDEISRLTCVGPLGVELPYLCPTFAAQAPLHELPALTEEPSAALPAQDLASTEEAADGTPHKVTCAQEDDAPKKMTCAQCGKHFPEVGRLIRHINTHLGIKAHACSRCPKRFAEKHNLAVHQRSHTQERPFQCQECGARLRYRKDLADHASRHRGDKPHACCVCGRTFLRSGELARHARTHSQVKKFLCPTCGKSFRRVDELRVHGRVHAAGADMPFACAVCAKSFPTRHKLRQHSTLHAERKMFVCHLCGKAFALDFYLNSHLKTHARRETYIDCPKCSRMFSTKENLEIHLRKFHAKIAKKGRVNPQSEKVDAWPMSHHQGGSLEDGAINHTEVEVTSLEIPGELLPIEDKEVPNQMIYFHSDDTEVEPTLIYINSVL